MKQKDELRNQMRALRKTLSLSPGDKAALIHQFFSQIAPPHDAIIAAYWPTKGECDPLPILHEAERRGIKCALPIVSKGTKTLSFAPYAKGCAMRQCAYDIHVPDTLERVRPTIMIMPLTAFDMSGQRLGQGGGYYDATLHDLRKTHNVTSIGLAYAPQEVATGALPTEPHDEPLSWILTPKIIKEFK